MYQTARDGDDDDGVGEKLGDFSDATAMRGKRRIAEETKVEVGLDKLRAMDEYR